MIGVNNKVLSHNTMQPGCNQLDMRVSQSLLTLLCKISFPILLDNGCWRLFLWQGSNQL